MPSPFTTPVHPSLARQETPAPRPSASRSGSRSLSWLARRRIVVTRLAALLVMAPLLWSHTVRDGTLVGEGLKLVAMILIGAGVIGRAWCSAYMAGQKDQRLVIAGPYSLCRNPLYFFSLLGAVGVGLSTVTLAVPAVIGLLFAAVYPAVIRREEAFLRAKFGATFEMFCASTPRFWPRWSSFQDGEVFYFDSRSFRRRVFDCGWFIWGAGLVAAVGAAQAHGFLPVWWHVW